MPHSHRGYLIVCLSQQIDDEFELEVFSNIQFDLKPSTSLLEDLKNHKDQKGRWKDPGSGGNINDNFFLKNPNFLLKTSSINNKIMIQITSDIKSPLGVYAIPISSPKILGDVSMAELDSAIEIPVFNEQVNTLYFDSGMKDSLFLIVPCTYNSRIVRSV